MSVTWRKLGSSGLEVYPITLGCMGMSGMYGQTDDRESIATIHEAIDRGVNLLDTGDFYGMGHNEMLIGRAIEDRREKVLLSVKFGAMRDPRGGWSGYDARPAAIRNFLAYTLQRLGVEYVDVYRPARLDPRVPIEDTVGAIADLIKQGYVRHIGLSEVSAETIKRASAVHPIVDLQIEYALVSRKPEEQILPATRAHGMSITAYGVLSRGLLAGTVPGKGDIRAFLPRFKGANGEQNRKLVEALGAFAQQLGTTPIRLTIAWVLAKGQDLLPTKETLKLTQLAEKLGAIDITLDEGSVRALEQIVADNPVAGARYDEGQMKALDSER